MKEYYHATGFEEGKLVIRFKEICNFDDVGKDVEKGL